MVQDAELDAQVEEELGIEWEEKPKLESSRPLRALPRAHARAHIPPALVDTQLYQGFRPRAGRSITDRAATEAETGASAQAADLWCRGRAAPVALAMSAARPHHARRLPAEERFEAGPLRNVLERLFIDNKQRWRAGEDELRTRATASENSSTWSRTARPARHAWKRAAHWRPATATHWQPATAAPTQWHPATAPAPAKVPAPASAPACAPACAPVALAAAKAWSATTGAWHKKTQTALSAASSKVATPWLWRKSVT